jgi:hypothetical protein
MSTQTERNRETSRKMSTEWYYQFMNDVVGPLSSSEFLSRVRAGQIKEETLVRKDDSQWVLAGQVGGLFDAARKAESHRICPYCGRTVEQPPTTCAGCNRKLVLSLNSRLTSAGQAERRPRRNFEAEAQKLRREADRSDIVRYAVLLFFWIGLLLVTPYLVYLASTGRLFFRGDLAVVSCVIVAVLVSTVYFVISRLG